MSRMKGQISCKILYLGDPFDNILLDSTFESDGA
jgi:hypothetical protein